jgi:hypothetical protein
MPKPPTEDFRTPQERLAARKAFEAAMRQAHIEYQTYSAIGELDFSTTSAR